MPRAAKPVATRPKTARKPDPIAFAKAGSALFLFQITVAKNHPVKGTGLLSIIESFGKGCKDVHLVFVLPASAESKRVFNAQDILKPDGKPYQRLPDALKGMRQWSCQVPLAPFEKLGAL